MIAAYRVLQRVVGIALTTTYGVFCRDFKLSYEFMLLANNDYSTRFPKRLMR